MIERAGCNQAGSARGFDEGARIIVARVRIGGGGDRGVAGQFLVGAERPEGEPGDRIEPVQGEDEQAEMVPPEIEAAVVDG